MKAIKLEGIVFNSKNFFEKDKISTLFTKEQGKIKVLAKSANTPKFRFGGKLDVSNHIEAILYRGKSFWLINECSVCESFLNIRTEFNRIAMMEYFLNIISQATHQEQPSPELFVLTLNTLKKLNLGYDIMSIKQEFQHQFLDIEGLLDKNRKPTDYQFKQLYESYSGKMLQNPIFI